MGLKSLYFDGTQDEKIGGSIVEIDEALLGSLLMGFNFIFKI